MKMYAFSTEGEFVIVAYSWFATRREAEAARRSCGDPEASPLEEIEVPRRKRELAEFLNRYTRC